VLHRRIMSASGTAAGYLYATGRLRGRPARKEMRIVVPPAREEPGRTAPAPAPKKMPKIEYRRRKRWILE
jgi:hypothetical protein